MMASDLRGLRLLVVEDEFYIAEDMVRILEDLGGEVIGPFARVTPARDAIRNATPDGAILDVKLDSGTILPLVRELLSRQVPVILATGYEAELLPAPLRHLPLLRKPFSDSRVRRLTGRIFPASGPAVTQS